MVRMDSRPSSCRTTIRLARLYPRALMARYYTVQWRLRHPTPPAKGACPSYKDMPGDLNRDCWDLNDFPCLLHPSPDQVGPTIWTDLHSMFNLLSWLHPLPSEAMES